MTFLDDHKIELTCPKCSRQFSEAIGKLRANPQLICPGCGVTINIEADGLDSGAKQVEQSLDKLGAALGRLGKHR